MQEPEEVQMQEPEQVLRHIIESTRLLAADYKTQVSILPSFVHIPDELALTFANSLLIADQALNAGLLDTSDLAVLQDIDRLLLELSGSRNAEFWTLDALEHDPRWEEIRQMAREALKALGKEMMPPALDWITYVGKEEV